MFGLKVKKNKAEHFDSRVVKTTKNGDLCRLGKRFLSVRNAEKHINLNKRKKQMFDTINKYALNMQKEM